MLEQVDDIEEAIRGLSAPGFPIDSILAIEADRERFAARLVGLIEAAVADPLAADQGAVFFAFHIVATWREKAAYRPVTALMRLPSHDLERFLGDAITATAPRVLAELFDGDPEPIQAIILDGAADEYARWSAYDALALAAHRGELPAAKVEAFLRDFHARRGRDTDEVVWSGFESAVAMLGLTGLVPLVEDLYRNDLMLDEDGLSYFLDDLARADEMAAKANAEGPPHGRFGSTADELATWNFVAEGEDGGLEDEWLAQELTKPAVNPYRGVGRNDPCPCGSGKKFKKCCLDAQ